MTIATLTLAVALTAQAQSPPPPGTLRIRIVDAVTSAALAGARIEIVCFAGVAGYAYANPPLSVDVQRQVLGPAGGYSGPPNNSALLVSGPLMGVGESDSSGEFSRVVPPGECAVASVQAHGYGARIDGRRHEVEAGETTTVSVRLKRLATVNGMVADERAAPLAGIAVFVQRRTVLAGESQWLSWARLVTDAQGRFTYSGPADEARRFDVPALEFAVSPAPFELASGETRTVELRGRRRPTFTVSGRLQRPGVSLGFVTAHLDRGDSPVAAPLTMATAAADASGHFTFAGVPEGAYRIRVDTSAPTGGYSPSDILCGSATILVDRNLENVVVPLVPGNEVSGRVQFEGRTPPPADFMVVAFQFLPANGRALPPQVGARGTVATNFWTRALPPDRYYLDGAGTLAGTWRVKDAMLDGRDVTEVPFDSSRGRIAPIVVTFTDRRTEIRGAVRGADGGEAAEATVAIFSTSPDAWNVSGRRVRVFDATRRGRFSVTDLPPGEYFAAAVASKDVPFDGAEPEIAWLRRLSATAPRFTLQYDVPLSLDLQVR